MTHPLNLKAGNVGKVYQVLRRAALAGQPCPSNAVIAEAVGYATPGGAASAIYRLAEAGLMRIERLGYARDIVFPDQVRTHSRAEFDTVRHNAAMLFGLETYQLVGRSRKQTIVRARIVATWVLRTKYRLSFEAIGQLLGARDHSTAIHYMERADYYREHDEAFRAATDALYHGEPIRRVHYKAASRTATVTDDGPLQVWCGQCESRVIAPCAWARCGMRRTA